MSPSSTSFACCRLAVSDASILRCSERVWCQQRVWVLCRPDDSAGLGAECEALSPHVLRGAVQLGVTNPLPMLDMLHVSMLHTHSSWRQSPADARLSFLLYTSIVRCKVLKASFCLSQALREVSVQADLRACALADTLTDALDCCLTSDGGLLVSGGRQLHYLRDLSACHPVPIADKTAKPP